MSCYDSEIRPGRYRHFKGGLYHVICVARLIDSDDEFVVYRPLYGDQATVIRPKAVFLQTVRLDNQTVPRFAFVNDDACAAIEQESGVNGTDEPSYGPR